VALEHLGRDRFASAVGSNFKVIPSAASATPVWVTLLTVADLPKIAPANPASFAVPNRASALAPASSGFVLEFGGSSALPQATHLLEHDTLGRFALFTVPAGGGQQLYLAVVNRIDSAIVAVSYSQRQALPNSATSGPAAAAIKASPATSSGNGSPSPGFSESPAVRRSAVRD
jgi:hypothetical protein